MTNEADKAWARWVWIRQNAPALMAGYAANHKSWIQIEDVIEQTGHLYDLLERIKPQ